MVERPLICLIHAQPKFETFATRMQNLPLEIMHARHLVALADAGHCGVASFGYDHRPSALDVIQIMWLALVVLARQTAFNYRINIADGFGFHFIAEFKWPNSNWPD